MISMGHFMGYMNKSWLGLPAKNRILFLRYAEFNCIQDGMITRSSFFCDLIGLLQQMSINVLPLQTGSSFIYPGPRTHDGLLFESHDPEESARTLKLVNRMIDDLDKINKSGEDCPPAEFLEETWHEDMIWYGPAGIGASYTISRYQEQQDKIFNGHICRLAEGNYACFFGWPNLTNTNVGGFMGLPASGVRADMRVVDIYRRQGDKLAENWVLIDLPWWLKQQGVDVFDRIKKILTI